jgi:hypothetical protein
MRGKSFLPAVMQAEASNGKKKRRFEGMRERKCDHG